MSRRLGPATRRVVVQKLRALGFMGPFAGTKHAFLQRGNRRIRIPNQKEIGPKLLRELLRQAGISRDEWLDA